MIASNRPRRLAAAGVSVVLALALVACAQEYPNTTFSPNSEFGRAIDELWDSLLFWGTLVFILVETILLFILFRFRQRPDAPEPRQVHGNTALEITWTLIPAVILILIAVPTVRTIFATQAEAGGDALQVEVIGHQWWWEFRYPEYEIATANELYLPAGRTVNFHLTSADVVHSFWIPQMGGKRDLVTNHSNYLWFTPDSTVAGNVWNGFCAEYCGTSHANMKFRAFTVSPEEFERWIALQRAPALVAHPAPGGAAAAPAPGGAATPGATPPGATPPVGTPAGQAAQAPAQGTPAGGTQPPSGTPGQTAQAPMQDAPTGELPAEYFAFPRDAAPDHVIPTGAIPRGLTFEGEPLGNAGAGRELYSRSACIGCHRIRGNPMSQGILGPELTHFGSRLTLGAGMYPNDARHLALWIKSAARMKPGSLMPPFGAGERDPRTGAMGALTDQQIADIVAYLLSLR